MSGEVKIYPEPNSEQLVMVDAAYAQMLSDKLSECRKALTDIYEMTDKVENWDRENILAEINTIALGALQVQARASDRRIP